MIGNREEMRVQMSFAAFDDGVHERDAGPVDEVGVRRRVEHDGVGPRARA